ncbi:MAG: methionyl-tRNA formyltransferase [Candidatus Moranbacteria bacterium RIFOXYA12_FULL_35_19]|nr:MAG: methionyl-tRNA formyltransferase [Candidatus Moranbacteria bacterium RIFOXYB12_FULL_35_8]OGI32342.1 MAG: methionyl-tRNA formyltransferase [Candidatus Moranbacteria bacterium RIFOXYC12_FULL_36_13]OGI35893.1 MAG: methionyl-tRNA formyltransferase [Candidatus Moranbacteria bacterium RIFOXYA12_FULL_35_19]
MGTPEFAGGILDVLIENKFNIISVYTQADKKIGRKQIISKSAVKKIAEQNKIKNFQPVKFNEDIIAEIKNQNPDLIIVSAYGKILPKSVLEIPKYGIINTHPSALPKYRGASPIQNAILNGEKKTTATIMLLVEKVDAGDILLQEEIAIKETETYRELSKRLSEISAKLLVKAISLWIEKKIEPKKQNEAQATFCQMIKKEDGKINWNNNAQDIYNRYRAFESWPGIFSYFQKNNQNLRIKLIQIDLDKNGKENNFQIGEVFEEDEKIKVKTGKGNIVLEEVQLEGKNKISIKDFIRGYPNFVGSVLK